MTALTENKESLGYQALRLRVSLKLTQQKLASLADVAQEQVDLFENNLPVPLDTRRRLLKELLVMKTSKR